MRIMAAAARCDAGILVGTSISVGIISSAVHAVQVSRARLFNEDREPAPSPTSST